MSIIRESTEVQPGIIAEHWKQPGIIEEHQSAARYYKRAPERSQVLEENTEKQPGIIREPLSAARYCKQTTKSSQVL